MSAEQHGVALCANTLDWLLSQETFSHRGLKAVLTAARTAHGGGETARGAAGGEGGEVTALAFYFAPFDAHGGLLSWAFGGGIGTNIGASLIWGFLAAFVGYLLARKVKAAWGRLHHRIDRLHERHDTHAERLERIGKSLIELHEKLDDTTRQEGRT